MKKYILFLLIIISPHHQVFADVIINEIAWMGTATSANDEWIELYNAGSSDIILDGWTLKGQDNSPSITLSGTIAAGGFFLLERTDDITVPTVDADGIYTGVLSNEGETLILSNSSGEVIDQVNAVSGWPKGNATNKQTMQKTSTGSWITAVGTPRAINAETDTSATNDDPDPVDNDPSEDDLVDDTETTDKEDKKEEVVTKVDPDPKYVARMILPEIFVQEVPIEFVSEVKKDAVLHDTRGRFEWSTGDGGSFVFYKSTPFMYTYQNPGEYVVVLRYYSNVFKEKPDTIHERTIAVIPAVLDINVNRMNDSLQIINQSTDTIDLSGWKLYRSGSYFTFPKDTYVRKGKLVTIPRSIHQLNYASEEPILLTPTNHKAVNALDSITTKAGSQKLTPFNGQTEANQPFQDEEIQLFNESTETVVTRNDQGNHVLLILFLVLLITALSGAYYLPKEKDDIPPV